MIPASGLLPVAALLFATSVCASVNIRSLYPSASSPQPMGSLVTWNATATDTGPGLLTFQYSVALGNNPYSVVSDFYPGTLIGGLWSAPPFPWSSISGEGVYSIQVIARDFTSGEFAAASGAFNLLAISSSSNSFVVTPTSNPLVALASAPPCAAGNSLRLTIHRVGERTINTSDWKACTTTTMNIYAAGMLMSTQYTMNYQIESGNKIIDGAMPVTFTTGQLSLTLDFPSFATIVAASRQTDQSDQTILHSFSPLTVATDRNGGIVWYYNSPDMYLFTRPLAGGNMLTLQSGIAWNPNIQATGQILREIDLAGNLVRETNVGALQQQLIARGATDLGPCGAVPIPAPVGAACLGSMHHEAIRLPNGYTALLVDIEKIFAPGTQGDTTGLNVDIIGDGVLVLDQNFQIVWYFDTFQHDGGAPQLDINRRAILGETCTSAQTGCPALFLAGTSGVANLANDWLHENSLDLDPVDGDLIVSARHQDWLYKIDYSNGNGTANILWLMGLGGSFTFNNLFNDPYPWFSHQHDAGVANTATGLLTLFDNGNTRVSPPPLGLGGGNSRGMALAIDEVNMTVTPILSQDLGYYAFALGSAELLSNGDYFFQPGVVGNGYSYAMELQPLAGAATGTVIFNLQAGQDSYRSWLMSSLYEPPPVFPLGATPHHPVACTGSPGPPLATPTAASVATITPPNLRICPATNTEIQDVVLKRGGRYSRSGDDRQSDVRPLAVKKEE